MHYYVKTSEGYHVLFDSGADEPYTPAKIKLFAHERVAMMFVNYLNGGSASSGLLDLFEKGE